jgi:hypothetical protein
MNHTGGETCRVSSHPPQRAVQYSMAFAKSCFRMVSVALPRSRTTLPGSSSRASRRTIFFTQGTVTHPYESAPRRSRIGCNRYCNGRVQTARVRLRICNLREPKNVVPHQRPHPLLGAVTGPGSSPPSTGRGLFPSESRNADLSARALCPSVTRGEPSQGFRRISVRLAARFAFAAQSGLAKSVQAPVQHLPCREIHADDLGHVFVSKPASASVAPLGVFRT